MSDKSTPIGIPHPPPKTKSQDRQKQVDGQMDTLAHEKSARALERKRAADRTARRLERTRTKEHIARLEERIQVLLGCEDANTASLLQRLLEENAALNQRIYDYQKQINSAKVILDTLPTTTSTSNTDAAEPSPPTVNKRSANNSEAEKRAPLPPPPPPNEASFVAPEQQYGDTTNLHSSADLACSSHPTQHPQDTFDSFIAGPLLLGHYGTTYLPGPRTIYLLHHPSPLSQTSIYRSSAGLPEFHDRPFAGALDPSAAHTLADIAADEKLDSFFGTLLPIFSPSLLTLYQGFTDVLSQLHPRSVLEDLIPGISGSTHPSPSSDMSQVPDAISLLKLSLAKYVAGTIREAQQNLKPEQMRSPTELVAVFWIVTKLFTWMAFPTANNYSQIPPWYRPTQAQHSVSHPSYIDSVVFPLLREKLVYTHDNYKDTKLLEHLNSLFVIKWEPKMWWMCQPETPVIFPSPTNHLDFQLEPRFEQAIWDLRSWRMLPDFVTLYPELASCVHT